MDKKVYTMEDYGSIQLNLQKLIEAKNLNPNIISRNSHTKYDVITKWCHGNLERMDLDVLARLCFTLDCTPGDIIFYKPPENDKK